MSSTRRTVKLSSLTPNRYSLPADRGTQRHQRRNPTLVCQTCNTHCQVRHGLVEVHRPEGLRCAGSGVKVVFDVTAEDWSLMLRGATLATEGPVPACVISSTVRRSNRVMVKAEPAAPTPVFRIAAAR